MTGATPMTHIEPDDAQEIHDGYDKENELRGSQTVSEHRWYTRKLVVFENKAGLFGFYYLDPATEEQDGQDRFEAEPVPVFCVTGREVTTTVYEVKKDWS